MKYSLSEAAKATGKNKTTIQRAIKSGKISALKGELGAYEIAPSELHRVFPPVAEATAQQIKSNDTQRSRLGFHASDLERLLQLEKDLAVAQERVAGIEVQKDQMADTIIDLRKRLDSSESRMTALLADHRPQTFWGSIFKKR